MLVEGRDDGDGTEPERTSTTEKDAVPAKAEAGVLQRMSEKDTADPSRREPAYVAQRSVPSVEVNPDPMMLIKVPPWMGTSVGL
jgi:hypothetical protein